MSSKNKIFCCNCKNYNNNSKPGLCTVTHKRDTWLAPNEPKTVNIWCHIQNQKNNCKYFKLRGFENE